MHAIASRSSLMTTSLHVSAACTAVTSAQKRSRRLGEMPASSVPIPTRSIGIRPSRVSVGVPATKHHHPRLSPPCSPGKLPGVALASACSPPPASLYDNSRLDGALSEYRTLVRGRPATCVVGSDRARRWFVNSDLPFYQGLKRARAARIRSRSLCGVLSKE